MSSRVVNRLDVLSGQMFAEFRQRFEDAVPVYDEKLFGGFVRTGASWDTVVETTERLAPQGFLRYWTGEAGVLMRLAGSDLGCASYLMGNHVIAQRMFRHDTGVMLYAPLRVVIREDAERRTWLSIDRPSDQFGSFGDADIAAVGRELDQKVAALLRHLDLAVPSELL
jgi:hypothetical protein